MKKLFLALLLISSFSSLVAQTLSKDAIADFAKAAYLTYRYQMGGFNIMVNRYFIGELDKKVSDAAIAIESIKEIPASRELVLQCFDNNITRDENTLFQYLHNMGMRATTAQEVTEYIRKKYKK